GLEVEFSTMLMWRIMTSESRPAIRLTQYARGGG
ncbi:MAG: hypothetical protein H6Q90_7270, partial [Deltaproteobacteria bacterium]|nr:hypothetical protein [Deltaproteobacteria bacterium]